MNARQFFVLVAEMREAQKAYYAICKSTDQVAKKQALQYSIRLEAQVDAEINRVHEILRQRTTEVY